MDHKRQTAKCTTLVATMGRGRRASRGSGPQASADGDVETAQRRVTPGAGPRHRHQAGFEGLGEEAPGSFLPAVETRPQGPCRFRLACPGVHSWSPQTQEAMGGWNPDHRAAVDRDLQATSRCRGPLWRHLSSLQAQGGWTQDHLQAKGVSTGRRQLTSPDPWAKPGSPVQRHRHPSRCAPVGGPSGWTLGVRDSSGPPSGSEGH